MLRDRWGVMFLIGVLVGAGMMLISQQVTAKQDTNEELIAAFYETENLVSVSPHEIKTALDGGTIDRYVVVDLRSQAEYEEGHVTGAVNVPIFVDPKESGLDNNERIVKAFQTIKAENPDKDIIAYCYSAACMASRKVGLLLSKEGIYIKHLNIGWNEWKYYWTIWNGEDGKHSEEYISSGEAPGEMKTKQPIAPCAEGELTC